MEQFQFSGDTPVLYYAQAAWEFKHDNADKANDWIASARKIYPSASNAQYAAGFYDLGWLKNAMAVSSPSPTASVGGAAVASTQTESSVPAIEPSPIPGVEVKTEDGTQLALAQTPLPGPKASEAVVNPTPAEVIVSNAKSTGTPALPEDIPAAPSATGISVESPSASATPSPAIALATAAPASTPAIAATPDVSVVTARVVASTPEASTPTPAPAITAPTAAPELAAATTSAEPVIESAASATPVSAASVATAASNATPTAVIAPEKVGKIAPVPTVGERISSLTGQRPFLVWILGLSGFGLLVSVMVMEIRRRIGMTQLGHRPATVTGPSLHDDEVAEETRELQASKHFVGGPPQVSVQLKASEPARRRAVIPVAKRVPDPVTVPSSEREVSEAGEASASVLETQVYEPTTSDVSGPSEVNEQISIQEWSPEPEPVEQGQPVPFQTVATNSPVQAVTADEPKIAEVAGVGRAIAGISALRETPEIPPASEEEDFAPQPTTTETMPETLQTPTAPVIRTSGGPTQPAHTASAPQGAAGGMHAAVQITLSCEIASMQLTPTFKMGALQLRPI